MPIFDSLPALSDRDLPSVTAAQEFLAHTFTNPSLARCAMTSPGWTNENQHLGWQSWKTLEWQGDAVLYLVLTDTLIRGDAKKSIESRASSRDWTQSNYHLASCAGQALWEHLFLGRGERTNNAEWGNHKFIADSLEALIGAVWFDCRTSGTCLLYTSDAADE